MALFYDILATDGLRVTLKDRDVTNVVTSRLIGPSCFAGINFNGNQQRFISEIGGLGTYHIWYPFGAVPSLTYWIGWEWSNAVGTVTQGPFPTPITGGTPITLPRFQNFNVQQQSEYGQWTGQLDLFLFTDSAGANTISTSTHQITCNTVHAGVGLESYNQSNTITNGACRAGVHLTGGIQGRILNNGSTSNIYYWYDEFNNPPASTYWVRGTFTNENNVDAKNPAGAPAWLPLPDTLEYYIESNTAGNTATATLTLELATDSSGSNIISTSTHPLSAFTQNGL